MINNEIYIIHKDWKGLCIINNNIVYRKDYNDEYGYYLNIKNKLIIKWEKWNEEDFYYAEDKNIYYLKEIFDEKYTNLYIFDNENITLLILNKFDKNFIMIRNDIIIKKGSYIFNGDKLYLKLENEDLILNKFIDNVYCSNEDLYNKILFELNIVNEKMDEKYIFNKISKKFINITNFEYNGTYNIIDNCITMIWSNGYQKKFYTNKYKSYDKIDENINIIKPNSIIIDNKILFSNISLCKNKIILTSIHYKNNFWDFNNIDFIVKNNKIINKNILDNDHFESSLSIILELENILPTLFIKIIYKKKYIYQVYLQQLNIIEHKISAMTLFKDDYELLERYLKHYNDLGIEIFYIYYNNIIDHYLINNLIKINKYNIKIYLTEWNYIYWYKYGENLKHHHAQTMCINDSLNILKNYGKYTLYNDLDEYIKLDKYDNFNDLIDNNKEIDMFIFKNRFCKMGNNIISYKNFDKEFDLSKIIKGNYWDSQREKNIIRLNSIDIMGVHNHYNKNKIKEIVIGEFYHIINFEEKNRENLMSEYITIL